MVVLFAENTNKSKMGRMEQFDNRHDSGVFLLRLFNLKPLTMKTKLRNKATRMATMITVLMMTHATAMALVPKPKLTVLNIDSQGMNLTAEQLGNIVRIEIDKLDTFEVTDRYDVSYLLAKHNLNIANCYGKICLVEQGQVIGSDYMLGGSVERYSETIIVTLKLIDVKAQAVIRTTIKEFLNLPLEIQTMIRISVREMFELKNDAALIQKLTKEFNYESMTNNPDKNKVNLSGPRMGLVFYTGSTANILKNKTHLGGFDMNPYMFQFGWQFEAQYLNEGNFQALVEFIPMISGLDQSRAIPSFTLLNGLRNNRMGLELAIGPTVNFVRKSKGYYINNEWHLLTDWNPSQGVNPYPEEKRLDSRGSYYLQSGFVLAAGWTYKSGRLNIPVNAFWIPSREGHRFGISMGYNAKKR
jgi:TolB-like protein